MGGAAVRGLDPVEEYGDAEALGGRGNGSGSGSLSLVPRESKGRDGDSMFGGGSKHGQLQPDVDVFFREMLVKKAANNSSSEDSNNSGAPYNGGNARKRSFTHNEIDNFMAQKSSKSNMLSSKSEWRQDISDDSSERSADRRSPDFKPSPLPSIVTAMPRGFTAASTTSSAVGSLKKTSRDKDNGEIGALGAPGGLGVGPPVLKSPTPLTPKAPPPFRASPDDGRKGAAPPSLSLPKNAQPPPRGTPSPTHANRANASPPSPLMPIGVLTSRPGTMGGKSTQQAVIETSDVKRNTVQLPSKFTHAKPTTGDWLKQRYIVNNYILLDTLGNGSYGTVRLCKDRTTDQLYAMKIISRDMLKKKKSGHSTETFLADIMREIAIMKKLSHPNVLRLFEVLDDPKVNKLYLVLEYMKKGDLINVLKSRDSPDGGEDEFVPLSDRQLWNIFRQVVSGVIYLHYQNIVHGDIKPQNLLVGEDGVVKIADFGISKMLDTSQDKVSDAAGTPAFMSPELCGGEAYDGQLADVWAIGATMFMLKFGCPPFLASSVLALYYKIQNDPLVFPSAINPNLKDLLEKMLIKGPSLRFTMGQVSSHIWLLQPPLYNSSEQRAFTLGASEEDQQKKAMFHPPVSYSLEHEAAMSNPVKNVTNNELFMSIGVGGTESANVKSNDDLARMEVGENVMATSEVFQFVDDGDYGDDDSDDNDAKQSSRDSSDSASRGRKSNSSSADDAEKTFRRDSASSINSQRDEMTEEEQALRGRKFLSKMRRSFVNEGAAEGASLAQSASVRATPAQSSSTLLGRSARTAVTVNAGNDSDDDAQEMTIDDVSSMLDTLGMQPRLQSSDAIDVSEFAINLSQVTAELSNVHNGVSLAHSINQGNRHSQEDRCVMIGEVTPLDLNMQNARQSFDEDFAKVSVACIFDGHNGSMTADALVHKLSKTLLSSDMFRRKNWKDALTETFRKVDQEICSKLAEEDDRSGSTGVVVIYDGRKNVLTVANVGDSRCILSRGGRAVSLHRLHRMSESDECERIIAAGGTVLKNRVNGVLAISRAFGDIEFKGSNPLHGLVIAVPDIHVERITPMTEFIVLATDGLFDVMEPQVVVNYVREKLHANLSLQDTARSLTKEAVDRGSIDNVTAVILSFSSAKLMPVAAGVVDMAECIRRGCLVSRLINQKSKLKFRGVFRIYIGRADPLCYLLQIRKCSQFARRTAAVLKGYSAAYSKTPMSDEQCLDALLDSTRRTESLHGLLGLLNLSEDDVSHILKPRRRDSTPSSAPAVSTTEHAKSSDHAYLSDEGDLCELVCEEVPCGLRVGGYAGGADDVKVDNFFCEEESEYELTSVARTPSTLRDRWSLEHTEEDAVVVAAHALDELALADAQLPLHGRDIRTDASSRAEALARHAVRGPASE